MLLGYEKGDKYRKSKHELKAIVIGIRICDCLFIMNWLVGDFYVERLKSNELNICHTI